MFFSTIDILLILTIHSDAFARLYDRRMLPPPSSSRTQRKASPCVCYLCPAHLSEYVCIEFASMINLKHQHLVAFE
jgi:hypothetical protein